MERAWLKNIGTPKTILTDQGRQFTASEFKEFSIKKGIEHLLTTPYNPQGNGIVERRNQEIGKIIRIYGQRPVKEVLRKIETGLNHVVHTNLSCSPHEAMFGTESYWERAGTREEHKALTAKINGGLKEPKRIASEKP